MRGIEDTESFGKALQQARYAAGLSQRDLARRLGISQLYVTEMEAGRPALYVERLFDYLREVGAQLAITPTSPGSVHGYRSVWPRAARPDDVAALVALDPATSRERFTEWIADPTTELVVIDGAIDWPSGTPMPARRAFHADRPLLGYRRRERIVIRPGSDEADVEALLRGQAR